jgi:TMEM175 potassium channel family protein
MGKGRLEAFSDCVISIIITIMVLEMKTPPGPGLDALSSVIPVFLSYVLSFVFVGIYWNNHHHLFQAAHRVNGRILWANLHLLFWLSLMPFVTRWMAETHFASWPVSLYGLVLLLGGCAYFILSRALIAYHGPDSSLATALGRDVKARTSLAFYGAAIALSFINSWIAYGLYVLVAIFWLVPDRRIEQVVGRGAD